MKLAPDIDEATFDALQEDVDAWRHIIEEVAGRHVSGPVVPARDGSVLVGVADDRVVKMYPPFLRDHFCFERAALERFAGRLSVETPRLVADGEISSWPYLVMTRLHGVTLGLRWPELSESQRCSLLEAIGALQAQAHHLPVASMRAHSMPWREFIAQQRRGCYARQVSRRLPPHLLADLERFVGDDDLPGDDVILTGEYTPMNLFVQDARLVAMFDFGDGRVGPADYDWLGPMCFLAAGNRARQRAFLSGYGYSGTLDRKRMLRLLLLHRYSNLHAQVALDGWQDAPDLDVVAALIWP